MTHPIPPRLLARVEHSLHKRLKVDVGPHLQRLAAHATSEHDFLLAAARLLVNPRDREVCLASWARPLSGDIPSAPSPLDTSPMPLESRPAPLEIDPAHLEHLRHALAHEVGPIAARLIRNEAARASSLDDLLARLQAHLDTEAQRDRFAQASHR